MRKYSLLNNSNDALRFVKIVEKNKCMQPECSVDDIEVPDPQCPVTQWSDWSPCSQTCGQGVTIRTRLFLGDDSKREECQKRKQFHQQQECTQRQECSMSRNEAKGNLDVYKISQFNLT